MARAAIEAERKLLGSSAISCGYEGGAAATAPASAGWIPAMA